MLRGFPYSITALIYWVLALCELWGVCTLGNESRCSQHRAMRLLSLVYVPLEIRVDAAMGNALQLSVCTLGDGEVFSSQAKLARTVAVLMCLGMRRCSRKMKSVSLYEF